MAIKTINSVLALLLLATTPIQAMDKNEKTSDKIAQTICTIMTYALIGGTCLMMADLTTSYHDQIQISPVKDAPEGYLCFHDQARAAKVCSKWKGSGFRDYLTYVRQKALGKNDTEIAEEIVQVSQTFSDDNDTCPLE